MKYILLFLINFNFVFCNEIIEKMETFGVVPDVIDVVPQKTIEVCKLFILHI